MRKLWATKALMLINIIVFAVMVGYAGIGSLMSGDMNTALTFGANFGPLTLSGEYWRLVTAMFIHFGLLHIAMNMWCLYQLGNLTDLMFGTKRYLLLYFVTGIGASLTSLYFHPMQVCAGASGAIFGLAGALVGALVFAADKFESSARSALLNNLLFFIVLNVALGSMFPSVDMSAHIGGTIVGFIAGGITARRGR